MQNINSPDDYHRCWFFRAARANRLFAVQCQRLLRSGLVDVNEMSSRGWSALHFASCNGNLRIIRVLLEHGAAVNAQAESGATALRMACECKQGDAVRLLIEHGADISIADANGRTALHSASRKNVDIMRLLIHCGADIEAKNIKGETPLTFALSAGPHDFSLHAVRCLLLAGANANTKNKSGVSALSYASLRPYPENVCSLLQYGADINAVKDERTLHLLAAYCLFDRTKIMEILLDHGANATIKDGNGKLPLDVACELTLNKSYEKTANIGAIYVLFHAMYGDGSLGFYRDCAKGE